MGRGQEWKIEHGQCLSQLPAHSYNMHLSIYKKIPQGDPDTDNKECGQGKWYCASQCQTTLARHIKRGMDSAPPLPLPVLPSIPKMCVLRCLQHIHTSVTSHVVCYRLLTVCLTNETRSCVRSMENCWYWNQFVCVHIGQAGV